MPKRAGASRRRARTIAYAVLGGALLVCGHAGAYRTGSDLTELAATPKVRWENAAIDYEINDQGAPGLSFSAVQGATSEARAVLGQHCLWRTRLQISWGD